MPEKFEYYVRRIDEVTFEVAKFRDMSGGEQPSRVYTVNWNAARGTGKCNCPAGSYRGTGKNDKHVLMVQQWIAGGEKVTAIIA